MERPKTEKARRLNVQNRFEKSNKICIEGFSRVFKFTKGLDRLVTVFLAAISETEQNTRRLHSVYETECKTWDPEKHRVCSVRKTRLVYSLSFLNIPREYVFVSTIIFRTKRVFFFVYQIFSFRLILRFVYFSEKMEEFLITPRSESKCVL